MDLTNSNNKQNNDLLVDRELVIDYLNFQGKLMDARAEYNKLMVINDELQMEIGLLKHKIKKLEMKNEKENKRNDI